MSGRIGTRARLLAIIPLALLIVTAPASPAADPRITPEERAKLVKYLRDSEQQFVALLDAVSDDQWVWKPAPDRWSRWPAIS